MLDKAAEFIKDCDPKDTTIVYHVGCGDGISAAVILAKTFERYFGDRPKLTYGNPNYLSTLRINTSRVIFVDIPADQDTDFILKLAESAEIAIFDHHVYTEDLNKHGILHVHPEFFSKIKGVRYPGAKLSYDICSRVTNIDDLDWIAAIGTIHDVGGEQWHDFIYKVFEKYPELGKKSHDFNSKLGLLVAMLTAGQDLKGGDKIAIQMLLEAERPSDILDLKSEEAQKLDKMRRARAEEIDYYIKNWKSLGEWHEKEKLVFLKLEPKHKISSAVATASSLRNPNVLFVLMTHEGDRVKLSFRQNESRVDCNWLARESTKDFEGTGGGHPPAAGGMIKAKYVEDFKKKVLALVNKK